MAYRWHGWAMHVCWSKWTKWTFSPTLFSVREHLLLKWPDQRDTENHLVQSKICQLFRLWSSVTTITITWTIRQYWISMPGLVQVCTGLCHWKWLPGLTKQDALMWLSWTGGKKNQWIWVVIQGRFPVWSLYKLRHNTGVSEACLTEIRWATIGFQIGKYLFSFCD